MRVAFAQGTEPRAGCPAFHAPSLFDSGDSTGVFEPSEGFDDRGRFEGRDQGPGEELDPGPREEDEGPPPPSEEPERPGTGTW